MVTSPFSAVLFFPVGPVAGLASSPSWPQFVFPFPLFRSGFCSHLLSISPPFALYSTYVHSPLLPTIRKGVALIYLFSTPCRAAIASAFVYPPGCYSTPAISCSRRPLTVVFSLIKFQELPLPSLFFFLFWPDQGLPPPRSPRLRFMLLAPLGRNVPILHHGVELMDMLSLPSTILASPFLKQVRGRIYFRPLVPAADFCKGLVSRTFSLLTYCPPSFHSFPYCLTLPSSHRLNEALSEFVFDFIPSSFDSSFFPRCPIRTFNQSWRGLS